MSCIVTPLRYRKAMTSTTTVTKTETKRMWTPPAGWFKAAHVARDAQAIYKDLAEDNNRRAARGLPTFEPSYELAYQIAERL